MNAARLSRDTNLSVVRRNDFDAVERWIHCDRSTPVTLADQNIELRKSQFGLAGLSVNDLNNGHSGSLGANDIHA